MAWTTADGGHEGNVIQGKLGGPKQGLYTASSTQNLPLGFRMAGTDGRCFRYAHFVSAVGPGKLAAVDWSVAGTASIDGKFTDSATTAKDDYGTTDSTIYLTDTDTFSTSDAADVFAGGYLHITDAAGEGYCYRIKSNDVGTSTGLMKLDLYDSLASALDSESSCSITGNPYKNLAIYNAGTDDIVAGVTMTDVSAGEYAWVQTWGVATALVDEESTGAITQGSVAVGSDDVDGGVAILGQGTQIASEALITSDFDFSQVADEPILGYFMNTAVDTEYTAVYFQISP